MQWYFPGAILFLAVVTSCAHRELPTQDMSVEEGLSLLGRVTHTAGVGPPTVVVIKDRHATHGAITRDRGPLRDVRRQNARAVRFLAERGFSILGCETTRGPLPEDAAAKAHRAAAREAIEAGDDLDSLTIYQPIRFEQEYRDRLQVFGIEDPELYAQDVASLREVVRLRGLSARHDVTVEDREQCTRKILLLTREIQRNTKTRGEAAASNLLEQADSAPLLILLMGGAHAASIAERLKPHAKVLVFECEAYVRR